ncbi:MAG: hypothetical protein RR740_00770 [Pseudomonas sp.]
MRAYAAGGSSKTPAEVLKLMTQVAGVMSSKGITLRCSEQNDADKAFVTGSKGNYFAYVPCGRIDESLDDPDAVAEPGSPWAIQSDIQPSSGDAAFARSLDAKFIMLPRAEKQWEVVANSLIYGLDRVSLAKMLICWSEPGDHVERYIRKAVQAGVKVYNLALTKDRETIQALVNRG